MKRNDSPLVDVCYGLLKSHVTCINCGNESVTFDAYNSLSLPIPINSTRQVSLLVQLLPLGSMPVQLELGVEQAANMSQLQGLLVTKLLAYGLLNPPLSQQSVVDSSTASEVASLSDNPDGDTPTTMTTTMTAADDEAHEHKRARKPSPAEFYFQFAVVYANRSYGVNKNFDPEDPPSAAAAIQSFVGKDICLAFQLENAAPIPKIVYGYQAYNGSMTSPVARFSTIDIYVGYKEVSTYNYESLRLLTNAVRVSVSTTECTGRHVHDLVWRICKRYIKETSIYASSGALHENRPYRIAIANQFGSVIRGFVEINDIPLTLTKGDIYVALWHNDARSPEHFEADLISAVRNVEIAAQFEENRQDSENEDQSDRWHKYGSASTNHSDKSKKCISIYDCINKFIEREKLAEAETLYCARCKEHLAPIKKMDLWSAPDVLVLHLKRFQYIPGQFSVQREKITELVDFPVCGLDLSAYVKGPVIADFPPLYDLYAVSQHMGGLGGGHYTASCKNIRNGSW